MTFRPETLDARWQAEEGRRQAFDLPGEAPAEPVFPTSPTRRGCVFWPKSGCVVSETTAPIWQSWTWRELKPNRRYQQAANNPDPSPNSVFPL